VCYLTTNLDRMSLDNHYQQQPTQKEVDACLDALEHEVSQHQVPRPSSQEPVLREGPRSDQDGLLWFMLVVGLGFLAWLVSMMRF
jgi:hypothetical protein